MKTAIEVTEDNAKEALLALVKKVKYKAQHFAFRDEATFFKKMFIRGFATISLNKLNDAIIDAISDSKGFGGLFDGNKIEFLYEDFFEISPECQEQLKAMKESVVLKDQEDDAIDKRSEFIFDFIAETSNAYAFQIYLIITENKITDFDKIEDLFHER